MTGGCVTATHARPGTLDAVLDKLVEAGADVGTRGDSFTVDMRGRCPKAVDIVTAPHPGFPTDMQAQLMTMNCIAVSVGIVDETNFEHRFMNVQDLVHLLAESHVEGNSSHAHGVTKLHGAPVQRRRAGTRNS